MAPEKQPCAHDSCPSELPSDENEIPPGWSVIRMETYTKQNVVTTYYYVCPNHRIVTTDRQKSLFEVQGAAP
jgi:hypothetical protein